MPQIVPHGSGRQIRRVMGEVQCEKGVDISCFDRMLGGCVIRDNGLWSTTHANGQRKPDLVLKSAQATLPHWHGRLERKLLDAPTTSSTNATKSATAAESLVDRHCEATPVFMGPTEPPQSATMIILTVDMSSASSKLNMDGIRPDRFSFVSTAVSCEVELHRCCAASSRTLSVNSFAVTPFIAVFAGTELGNDLPAALGPPLLQQRRPCTTSRENVQQRST